jgi:cholesterol oxidase
MADESHFDAVIVGSGFGGSVMACRLAEAGLRVCVLERGKPYPPNSFPRTPARMKRNFWDPSEGLLGLFDIWAFRGAGAIVSSGLGGGSLIYANVLIRKDEKWFVHESPRDGSYEHWPITRAELDPHYDRVERMLDAQQYPFSHTPYDQTSKTRAFRDAARKLGLDWYLPKLAVTFANGSDPPVLGEPIRGAANLHGHTRYTCRLCGECDIGCNYGSKNTLDYTYLSEAKLKHGADIRTLCEVRTFESRPDGGYSIQYVQHEPERHEGQPHNTRDPEIVQSHTLTADRLILSAGTLGTTYLLLRNRTAFPHLSPRIGQGFSSNGDLLSFAIKASQQTPTGRSALDIDASHGPVITSTIRVPDREDGAEGRGFYLQDAGYPDFVNWMLQIFDTPSGLKAWSRAAKRIVGRWLDENVETDISGEIARWMGDCELSSGLLPLLGMGRDMPTGRMTLRGGLLDVDWSIQDSKVYFDRVRETMRAIGNTLGASFLDDPLWWVSQIITVHPLGGCRMAQRAEEGVVDTHGEVFNYPGLYIADGSVMPGPVGANPSLTIAALADRFADHIVEQRSGETRA